MNGCATWNLMIEIIKGIKSWNNQSKVHVQAILMANQHFRILGEVFPNVWHVSSSPEEWKIQIMSCKPWSMSLRLASVSKHRYMQNSLDTYLGFGPPWRLLLSFSGVPLSRYLQICTSSAIGLFVIFCCWFYLDIIYIVQGLTKTDFLYPRLPNGGFQYHRFVAFVGLHVQGLWKWLLKCIVLMYNSCFCALLDSKMVPVGIINPWNRLKEGKNSFTLMENIPNV